MGHAHNENIAKVQVIPPDKEKIKKIWITTLYLGIATAIEFIIAFIIDAGPLKTSIFVILTFYKSFYIVGEFMHLKHEVKMLIWSIVLPVIFICWLITAMLAEGDSVFELRNWVMTWF